MSTKARTSRILALVTVFSLSFTALLALGPETAQAEDPPGTVRPIDSWIASPVWAGVVARPKTGGGLFSLVHAQWAEPNLTCDQRTPLYITYWPQMAIWAGLGGTGKDVPLVQIGTKGRCVPDKGRPGLFTEEHSGFYELYSSNPLDPGRFERPINRPVSARDVVAVNIQAGVSSYKLELFNATKGWVDTEWIPIKDSAANPAIRTSAEWIAERPIVLGPLAGCDPLPDGSASQKPLARFEPLTIRGRTSEASTFEAWRIGSFYENGKILAAPTDWARDEAQGDATTWIKWNGYGCKK